MLEAKQVCWRAQEPQLPGASGARGPVPSTTRSQAQGAFASPRLTGSTGLQEGPTGKQTKLRQGRLWYSHENQDEANRTNQTSAAQSGPWPCRSVAHSPR